LAALERVARGSPGNARFPDSGNEQACNAHLRNYSLASKQTEYINDMTIFSKSGNSPLKQISVVLSVLATASAVHAIDVSKLPAASKQQGVTFDKDIKPLLEASCVKCHSGDRPKAGLRLDTLQNVLKGSKEGKVLSAGQSEKSLIVEAVSQLDPETAMPPRQRGGGRGPRGPGGPAGQGGQQGDHPQGGQSGDHPQGGDSGGQAQGGGAGGPGRGMGPPPKPLTAEQVGLVRAWIDQGAK